MDLSKTAWNLNMNYNPLKMRSNNFTVHIDMEDPKLADYFLRKLWYFHIVLIIYGQGYGFARNSLRCVRQKKRLCTTSLELSVSCSIQHISEANPFCHPPNNVNPGLINP